jgi:hypothetical protein
VGANRSLQCLLSSAQDAETLPEALPAGRSG